MWSTRHTIRSLWSTLTLPPTPSCGARYMVRQQHTATVKPKRPHTAKQPYVKKPSQAPTARNNLTQPPPQPQQQQPPHTRSKSADGVDVTKTVSRHQNNGTFKPRSDSTPHTHSVRVTSHGTVTHTVYQLPAHTSDPRPQYSVSTPEQLSKLCDDIQDASIVAFDCEFLTFPRYTSSLEVIQIGTDKLLAAVDVPAVGDAVQKLVSILMSKLLIVHSGKIDLELLRKLAIKHNITPTLPAKIFDTQIACSLVGIANMISLKEMVEQLADVDLSKTESLTDWSKRPLTVKQLEYALNDVRHLHTCHTLLLDKLKAFDRVPLFDVECGKMIDETTYAAVDPSTMWRDIYHHRKLDSQSVELTILQHLCAWRDTLGREIDWSPNVLIRNEQLYAIALQKPTSNADLNLIQGMKPAFVSRHGNRIISIVQAAEKVPVNERPVHAFAARDNDRLNFTLASLLTAWKTSKATEMQINPFVLASLEDINEIASSSTEALTAVLHKKLEQSTASDTKSTVAEQLATPIVSSVFRQKPVVDVNDEINVLMQLQVLNDWRAKAVGLDLLRIATGRPVKWSAASSQVEWSDSE